MTGAAVVGGTTGASDVGTGVTGATSGYGGKVTGGMKGESDTMGAATGASEPPGVDAPMIGADVALGADVAVPVDGGATGVMEGLGTLELFDVELTAAGEAVCAAVIAMTRVDTATKNFMLYLIYKL